MRAETQALLDRMRHLVSLNDPEHGGPYGGYAAERFVSTMKDAIAEIERLAEAEAAMAPQMKLRAAARATSSTAIVMRRARIPKRCDCGRIIERGERYLRHSLAPNHPDVGNVGWWDAIECQRCVKPERRELFGERCF